MSEHLGTPPEGENTSGKPAGVNVSGGGSSGLSIGARPADVPGANLTPEEIARRASGRGTWHRRASKPVSHWMFTLVGVLLLHKFIPNSGWLMVHIITLGLITNSILIWSQHFTEALMKIKIPDEHRGTQVRRIFILNAGILLLMIGMVGQLSVPGLYAATVVGALIVGSMVAWHGISLLKQVRQALPSRFGVTIRFYIVAALLLPLGAAFGGMIAYPNLSGTLHSQFLLAHEAVNVLGFVGITAVGTLVTFWPTMLRTKMVDKALTHSLRALYLMCGGLALTVVGAILGMRPLAAAGLVVYLVALLIVAWVMVRTLRTKRPNEYPPMSVGMGFLWLIVGVAATAYMVATTPFAQLDMRAVTPIFVVGFLLQLLLGAMSYLLPQRMGGGPAVVRASNKEFSRFAAARVTAVNLALLIFMMPSSMVGQSIKIAVAIVGALALMAFIPLMVRGVKASVNTRKEMMAARARGEKPVFNQEALTPEPVPHAKQSFQAALAVAMAFLLGFAVNPSALNLPSFSSAGSVAATGQTTTVQVKATSNYRFTPAEVEVPAGNRLVVEVTNDDEGMTHDLTFDNGATTGTINPGETKTVDAGVITADQEGYCSVAGHRSLGMVFKVKATGASANQVAQGGHNHGSTGTHNHAASGSTPTLMTVANSRIDMSAAPGSGYKYRDPNIPAPNTATQVNGKTVRKVTLEVEEVDREVAPGVTVHMWTFNGQNMAPILRGKVGDIFEITLVNNGTMGHSLDFHAGMVSPDNTMKTIAPGERLVYRFEAKGAGIWLYHCGTAPLSLHMTQGMYGAVIIDPADLDPVDHEYVMVQGEAYLHDTGKTASDGNKLAENSPELIAAGTPTLTMFNGHATQYKAKPLQVKKGERIRIWVMAAGPNHGTSFHVVGSQFDTVYKEGGYLMRRGADAFGSRDGHSQALDLAPAQGGFVEMQFLESGTYTFVNHSFSEMERGAAGKIVVTDR
ncbi:multicopper oxidase domain-containing protein [Rothia sp. HMSC069C04]|uniref:multicopper oxidase domain-containing protein n=1 Tax=Rothia sp. HMSC069C04 TaxID=1739383 RepID=UPI0008A1F90E|nr:multicopper oxidase domain-containing protein [Rothia sp. HMSC069C04]OFR65489.1 copper oxidase [Rothia sp. HMSC069C04]